MGAPDFLVGFLLTGERLDGRDLGYPPDRDWQMAQFCSHDRGGLAHEAWQSLRPTVLPAWAGKHPGTRPWAWWLFDAPRSQDYGWRPPDGRLRIGGSGEVLVDAALDDEGMGVPTRWRSGTVDPRDPPTFESSASYLRRHGLLIEGEERRLRAGDFEPVALEIEEAPEALRA